MNDTPDAPSFTLTEVVGDALAALRAGWLAYAESLVILLAVLSLSCCGVTCLLVPLAGILTIGVPEGTPPWTPLIVALYVAYFGTFALLFAVYEAITLCLTHAHARARAERPSFRAAVEVSLRRMPALVGTVMVRLFVDILPPALLASLVGAVVALSTPGEGTDAWRQMLAVASTIAYFVSLGWWLGSRGWIGLALSIALRDGVGPREAMVRSIALLRGRRAHFIAFRLVCLMFGFAIYCGSFVPLFAVAAGTPHWLEGVRDSPTDLIFVPIGLFYCVLVPALHALDTVMVAAYHGRISRPVDASTIAKIFD